MIESTPNHAEIKDRDINVKRFDYNELRVATENFSPEMKVQEPTVLCTRCENLTWIWVIRLFSGYLMDARDLTLSNLLKYIDYWMHFIVQHWLCRESWRTTWR